MVSRLVEFDNHDRATAPLRRLKEAAYWCWSCSAHVGTPEFDHHVRAFAQALVSAEHALRNLWKMSPKHERHQEMGEWWAERRQERKYDEWMQWVRDRRTDEFHTLPAVLPPSKKTPSGWMDPSTGGFFAFLDLHYLPGDRYPVQSHMINALFALRDAMEEFAEKFGTWEPGTAKQLSRRPRPASAKRPKSTGVTYTFDIGPGPYESFGPGSEAAKQPSP